MKKYLIPSLIAIGVFALVGGGVVAAQGFFGGFGNLTPEEKAEKFEAGIEKKADLFGVTTEEMKNYWANGKTFAEIAEEQGLSEDELKEKMQTQKKEMMKTHVDNLVTQGVITQEQADQRLQVMEERMTNGEMKGGCEGGPGMHHGGGFFH